MLASSPIWFSALIIVLLNLLAFLIGYFRQTDKLTDITYSLSFFVVTIAVFAMTTGRALPQLILFAMVLIWSMRLGTYLLTRIIKTGKDERFDEMRPSLLRFLGFWSLQTLTIWLLMLPVVIYFGKSVDFHPVWHLSWSLVWLGGFLLETVADQQKFTFRNNAANNGQFVNTGLWSVLRHPNYTGEIICWLAIFLYVLPDLTGLEQLSAISPIWITLLLVFVSGIPLLEKGAIKKYGELPGYKQYLDKTKRLIPFVW